MVYDMVVVGAGVLGTFHALFAAERGWSTLLIERNEFPRDASVRNFGMVIAGAIEPGIWRERALASTAIYRDLAQRVPFSFGLHGIQYIASTALEAQVLEEFAKLAPALGYECMLQDTTQALDISPLLNEHFCKAALLFPSDFTVDARSFFRTLIPWMVEQLRCTYMPRTVVIGVGSHDGRCRLRTAAGETVEARTVLICTGSDLHTLFPRLYTAHGLTTCKLQMMRTVPQPGLRLNAALGFGLSLRRYGAFALAPSHRRLLAEPIDPFLAEHGVHVLMAQNAAGEIILGDSHQYAGADESFDDQLDMAIDAAILAYARRAARLPAWDIAARWYGVYPVHPQDQVLQETVDERIHVITGIGGKGMTCGPGLAREVIGNLVV